MDVDRLIRIQVAGWGLVVSWALHHWIFGGNFQFLLQGYPKDQPVITAAAAILVALTGGPLLGFVVHDIAELVVRTFRGGRYPDLDVPSTPEERERFFTALGRVTTAKPSGLQQVQENLKGFNTRPRWPRQSWSFQREAEKVQPFFNAYFHSHAPDSLIQYCTRRWTAYWMHANLVCAMAMGLTFALFKVIFLDHPRPWQQPFPWERALAEAVAVFYVSHSIRRLKSLREDVRAVAHQWLYAQSERQGER